MSIITIVRSPDDPSFEARYLLTARTAVICAYAQFVRKDGNTADYERRYGHLVRKSRHGWYLDDGNRLLWAPD